MAKCLNDFLRVPLQHYWRTLMDGHLSLFRDKMNWACFLESRLTKVSTDKPNSNLFLNHFTWSLETLMFFTVEKIDVSSANSVVFDDRFFDRSFM